MTERRVTVRGYASLLEAQIVCARLVASGFSAVVPDQQSGGIVGEFIGGAGGIRVQVPESEFARARALLAQPAPASTREPEPAPPARPADRELRETGTRSRASHSREARRRTARSPSETPSVGHSASASHCPMCGTPLTPPSAHPWWRRATRTLLRLPLCCSGCRRDLRDLC